MQTETNVPEGSKLTKVPSQIEVLWELHNGKKLWWRAQVSDVEYPVGQAEAVANITYDKKYGHPSFCSVVRFFQGHLLKEKTGSEDLILSWRAARKQTARNQNMGSLRKRNFAMDEKPIERLQQELKVLREGHAETALKMTCMEKEIESLRSLVQLSGTRAQSRIMESFKSGLCHHVIVQAQKSIQVKSRVIEQANTNLSCYEASNDVICACVKVTVDCDLNTFELFARDIRNSLGHESNYSTKDVQFYPDFQYTQAPGEGSKQFNILFSSLQCLCNCIGIMSLCDRKELMVKLGSWKGRNVIRLLGTYLFDETNESRPTIMLPGRSSEQYLPVEHASNGVSVPAFIRNSRQWSVEDRRYISPLSESRLPPPVLNASSVVNNKELNGRAFQAVCKKSETPESPNWVPRRQRFECCHRQTGDSSPLHSGYWKCTLCRTHQSAFYRNLYGNSILKFRDRQGAAQMLSKYDLGMEIQ